jgi:putative ABC transport system permease protein
MLLRASTVTGTRRAAAAMIPVLIIAGLTASILGANAAATAAATAAGRQQAAAASFVVLPAGTPGLTTGLLAEIHGISGAEATAVTDTSMLAYQPQVTALHLEAPIPVPYQAIGIDQPSAALHLTVIAGSLNGLNDHTVAVDSSWNEHVGGTMSLWQPEGTPMSLKIVAVVAARLSGPSLIVDRRNAGAALPDRAYVKTDSAGAAAALRAAARTGDARVVPVSGWTAAVSDQQAKQNQVGLELLLGIAVGYCAIGMASTFLMSVAGRRPELALLHSSGAIRRQIVWFITAESLVLTLIAIALSGVVSCLVLGSLHLALAREVGSVPVTVPWPAIGAILAGCVAIAVLTTAVPAWNSLSYGQVQSSSA